MVILGKRGGEGRGGEGRGGGQKICIFFFLATIFILHKTLTLNAAVEGAEVGKSGQGA